MTVHSLASDGNSSKSVYIIFMELKFKLYTCICSTHCWRKETYFVL